MGHWTDLFSFAIGAVRSKDIGYLVLSNDEMSHKKIRYSGFVQWHAGEWADGGHTEWLTAGIAIAKQPLEQMIAVSEFGKVLLLGSGDRHEEEIGSSKNSPKDRGPLRGVRNIEGNIYVVGMDRQVYRRDGVNLWSSIDKGARPTVANDEVVGFESIDGFKERDMYAVGWEGEIWRYNGKIWTQIDSPTNFILVDVCCGGDSKVYACGRRGLLLRGKDDQWGIIEHESITDDIWSLAWFREKLYLSTMNAVYTLDKNDQLKKVNMGKDVPETCFNLSTADGVLWSIGAKDVMSFDGKKWMRID